VSAAGRDAPSAGVKEAPTPPGAVPRQGCATTNTRVLPIIDGLQYANMPPPYRNGGRLLAHCVSVTRCEHLGLLLTERAGSEILGLPGLLLLSARDVGAGLRELVRYMDLHNRGALVLLAEDGDTAKLGYSIVTEVEGAEQLQDMAMTIAVNLMRSFCGVPRCTSEVLLPRRRPTDASHWLRCLRAPVRFEAARCGLRFPAHWLARSLPAANPTLHQYLKREADRLQSLLGKGLVDEVRRIVQGAVSSPPCNAARVAHLLGMHERTLNRRLQSDGTTFRHLREDVLYAMARQMLDASSMPMTDIALALGYAESSSFIHAFTRWSGRTPDRWRNGDRSAALS
jgi:AraC-like DNA-binding protein